MYLLRVKLTIICAAVYVAIIRFSKYNNFIYFILFIKLCKNNEMLYLKYLTMAAYIAEIDSPKYYKNKVAAGRVGGVWNAKRPGGYPLVTYYIFF